MPLPDDERLSVSIQVSARWKSALHYDLPAQQIELPTDFAVYPLGENPNLADFDRSLLSTMLLPTDPDWSAFTTENDEYFLHFSVSDTGRRLERVVLKNLETGKILSERRSNRANTRVEGEILLPWSQTYCLIEGYDLGGVMLFHGIASNGQPDTFVYLTLEKSYAAYRPKIHAKYGYPHDAPDSGIEGNPFRSAEIEPSAQTGAPFSIAGAFRTQTNDTSRSNPLSPPSDLQFYEQKRLLTNLIQPFTFSHDRLNDPSLVNERLEWLTSKHEFAFSNLLMPPFSETVGYWEGKFSVRARAYLAVPYNVAKHKPLFDRLKTVFESVKNEIQAVPRDFPAALIEGFERKVKSGGGEVSGMNAGMVRAECDERTLEIEESQKRLVVNRPLYGEVTFTFLTDPPDAALKIQGKGSVELVSTAPGIPDEPPPPPTRRYPLRFVNGTAKARLPKGWLALATVEITNPPGYTLLRNSAKFATGFDPKITFFVQSSMR